MWHSQGARLEDTVASQPTPTSEERAELEGAAHQNILLSRTYIYIYGSVYCVEMSTLGYVRYHGKVSSLGQIYLKLTPS